MPNPEEASSAEIVNYTVQALWSYGYMKTAFSASSVSPAHIGRATHLI